MSDEGKAKCTKIVVIQNNEDKVPSVDRLKGMSKESNALREKEC